jgi:adenylate cyclase class 2
MAGGNIEIEVKFPLLNAQEVLSWLGKNAKPKYESRQLDEYFNAPHRDFFAGDRVDDWLRLRREANGKCSINYKHWHQTETESFYCDEFESGVESPDNMRKILTALQFKPLVKVDKIRRAFELSDVEIAIDEVEGLGFFIEAEYYGSAADKAKIKGKLVAAIKNTGAKTGPEDARGYPYWLLEKIGFIKKH